MVWNAWNEEEVESASGKIKSIKQPGPDKIKGGILKWLHENSICFKTLTQCLNNVIIDNEIPNDWKTPDGNDS